MQNNTIVLDACVSNKCINFHKSDKYKIQDNGDLGVGEWRGIKSEKCLQLYYKVFSWGIDSDALYMISVSFKYLK